MCKLSDRSSHGLALLAVIVSAGQVAQADEASATDSSASTLQEVVVTAQKREEKLHDVPMGVTAITPDEMQKQQLVSLDDLQYKVPCGPRSTSTRARSQVSKSPVKPNPLASAVLEPNGVSSM